MNSWDDDNTLMSQDALRAVQRITNVAILKYLLKVYRTNNATVKLAVQDEVCQQKQAKTRFAGLGRRRAAGRLPTVQAHSVDHV